MSQEGGRYRVRSADFGRSQDASEYASEASSLRRVNSLESRVVRGSTISTEPPLVSLLSASSKVLCEMPFSMARLRRCADLCGPCSRGGELSGSQIRDKAHSWVLFSGTIYPILSRLERAGWLESRWEEIDPKEEKRPRKRFYRVTENGERLAKEAIRA